MVVVFEVIVAVAVPGANTAVGLTVHTGGSVVVIADVTWQLNATVPVNPELSAGAIWIVVDETPPGATAAGDKAEGCSVNSDVPWPAAVSPNAKTAAIRQQAARARPIVTFNLDLLHPNFDMNMKRL